MLMITSFANPRVAQAFVDYMATQGVILTIQQHNHPHIDRQRGYADIAFFHHAGNGGQQDQRQHHHQIFDNQPADG
ncbi:hypothetical protein MJM99_33545, partial [Salmonella enterica subsp. enterica serovar Kentucky]|nr:hypothetical protein [Salmonella enterica subsp. enterica serovar Kentucky]